MHSPILSKHSNFLEISSGQFSVCVVAGVLWDVCAGNNNTGKYHFSFIFHLLHTELPIGYALCTATAADIEKKCITNAKRRLANSYSRWVCLVPVREVNEYSSIHERTRCHFHG